MERQTHRHRHKQTETETDFRFKAVRQTFRHRLIYTLLTQVGGRKYTDRKIKAVKVGIKEIFKTNIEQLRQLLFILVEQMGRLQGVKQIEHPLLLRQTARPRNSGRHLVQRKLIVRQRAPFVLA